MNKRNEAYESAMEFMESEEMRECFRNTLFSEEKTTRAGSDVCQDIIIGSRSNIEDKLAALRKLPPTKKTLDLINIAETAMSELKTVKNSVYLTTLHFPYDTGNIETGEERKPFLSFELVMSYIQRETAELCELYEESLEQCMEHIWYEVEKFIHDENGELLHNITWTLNAKGEIVFFKLSRDLKKNLILQNKNDDWEAWLDWEGRSHWEYPPVPFDFGDIITIDMRPFYEAFHGVIVRLGDNRDCCAAACIYCDKDGNLDCSPLKHNMDKALSKVSPLYRAEIYLGELPENEQALKTISAAIKNFPLTRADSDGEYVWRKHELANQFDEFFYRSDYKKLNSSFGCSWDEFRKKFKI